MRSDECDSDEEEEERNLSDQPLWSTGNRGDVVDLGAAVAAVAKKEEVGVHISEHAVPADGVSWHDNNQVNKTAFQCQII